MDFIPQPLRVSITELAENPGRVLDRLRSDSTYGVLEVQGAHDVVVVPLEVYQALADRLDELETIAALNEAASEIDRGEGSHVAEALARLKARLKSEGGQHP
jgi:hypothetical protein